MNQTNLTLRVLILISLFLVTVTPASSHVLSRSAEQEQDETAAYKSWYDTNAANDLPKAFELAKAYLKNFPKGKYAEYLNKWLLNARYRLFDTAVTAKDSATMIRLGNEVLAVEPENLNYLYLLVHNLNLNELNARPANHAHATEASDYARRAIKLIEAGKQPTDTPQWNQNQALSYLYQILGTIEEQNKNMDAALENYLKSGRLDANNSYSFFSSGRLYEEKYLKAADAYRALPEADRNATTPSPQVASALKAANDAADATIDSWIKFLKLTATNNPYGPARDEIKSAVADLYKYRHPDSPDAYLQLIKP